MLQPGDMIVVTGEFGGSILGKQFDFTPRSTRSDGACEALWRTRAMDVSDGLSLDLNRMCGIIAARWFGSTTCRSPQPRIDLPSRNLGGAPRLEHALSDGEDFELILALPRLEAERAVREQPIAAGLTIIGEFIAERGLWSVDSNGKRTAAALRL